MLEPRGFQVVLGPTQGVGYWQEDLLVAKAGKFRELRLGNNVSILYADVELSVLSALLYAHALGGIEAIDPSIDIVCLVEVAI